MLNSIEYQAAYQVQASGHTRFGLSCKHAPICLFWWAHKARQVIEHCQHCKSHLTPLCLLLPLCFLVTLQSGLPVEQPCIWLQAAYQAALTQQAAAAQQLLLQQQGSQYIPPPPNFGHGAYSEALAAQVAAQLSLTPGYFNNQNINAAAAAAAAAAVQNIMSEHSHQNYKELCMPIIILSVACPSVLLGTLFGLLHSQSLGCYNTCKGHRGQRHCMQFCMTTACCCLYAMPPADFLSLAIMAPSGGLTWGRHICEPSVT